VHADSLSGHALSWLLTYGLHSTLLLCLAWLVSSRLAADAQRARELLWRAALLGGLFTASAQVAIGHEPWLGRFALGGAAEQERAVELERPAPEPSEAPRSSPSSALASLAPSAPSADTTPHSSTLETDTEQPETGPAAHGPSFGSAAPRLELGAGGLQIDFGFPAAGFAGGMSALPSAEPRSQPSTQPERRFPWAATVLALWSLGAVIGLARLALALRALREGLAERFALEAGPLARTLAELRCEAGLRRRVRLSCAPGLAAPVALGWLRPEICVPVRAATDLTPEQQRGMLAHELAHLVRRDPLWLLACRALEGLLFFQPLNRLARRELQETAEYLCDDWAAARSGGGLALASCLAEVAGWFAHGSAPRTPALAAGMTSRPSALSARIERLLASQRPAPSARWSLPTVALLLAGVAAAAPGAGAKPGAAPSRELAQAQRDELTHEPRTDALAIEEVESDSPADPTAAADELALSLHAAEPATPAVHPRTEQVIADWLARENGLSRAVDAQQTALDVEALAQPRQHASASLAERLTPALSALDEEIAGLEHELAAAERLAERRGLAPALRARLDSVERALGLLHERRERLDALLEHRDARALARVDARND